MKRGTTPTHIFTLPFDTETVKTARIIYSQSNEVIFVKTGDQLTLDGDTITVKLTQEDTLAFDCKKNVEIQVRVLTHSGDAMASDIEQVSPYRCLEDEVLK